MSISVALIVPMFVLAAAGVYLLLDRSLTRVLIGFLLVGNAANLLILSMAGPSGLPALFSPGTDESEYTDPLPQALVLTAIVITFGVSAFLLALIYRSWRLARRDIVENDEEDADIAAADSSMDDDATSSTTVGDTEFDGDDDATGETPTSERRDDRSREQEGSAS